MLGLLLLEFLFGLLEVLFGDGEVFFEGGDLLAVGGDDAVAFFYGLDLHRGDVHVREEEQGLLGGGRVSILANLGYELLQRRRRAGAIFGPLCLHLLLRLIRHTQILPQSFPLTFRISQLEIRILQLLPHLLVLQLQIINPLLQNPVAVLEVGDLVQLDRHALVEAVDLLLQVQDLQLGACALLVQLQDLFLLLLDRLLVSVLLVLLVGDGLLQFLLHQVELLLELELVLGQLVVLGGFGLDAVLQLAFLLLKRQLVPKQRFHLALPLLELLLQPLLPIPGLQQPPIQPQRLLRRLLQPLNHLLILFLLPLHCPFQILDLGIGILLGLGQVVDLLFVVLGHLAVVPLLGLELAA